MYLFCCDSVAVSTGLIIINQSVRNGYVRKDSADSTGDSHHLKFWTLLSKF